MSTDTVRESLVEKLHPQHFPNMSAKMVAIVAYIVEESWTTPEISSLSITSDGFLVSMGDFLGSASDFENNLDRLAVAAELTREEQQLFWSLCYKRIEDWR